MKYLPFCLLLFSVSYAEFPAETLPLSAVEEISPDAPTTPSSVTPESPSSPAPLQEPGLVTTEISSGSNPGAVNAIIGTGYLGELLGLKKDRGLRIGGSFVGDINYLFSGGAKPDSSTGISSLLLGLYIEPQKFSPWKGSLFGFSFLRVDGGPTTIDSGAVQPYDALGGIPPRHRSEFYEYWLRQEFFNKKLVVRVGKMVTSAEFNNLVRERPLSDQLVSIPATTSLIYLPIFVSPTLIGVMPGYYNTAFGLSLSYNPMKSLYISAGVYDGNLARGKNTGLRSPQFNQYVFNVAEIGHSWFLGDTKLPGAFSVGGWCQTGKFVVKGNVQHGYGGIYCFGSQRLWYRNPGKDRSGILSFFRADYSNSYATRMNGSIGGGLTFFGLVPRRPLDSFGAGVSVVKLNDRILIQKMECLIQAYYRMNIYKTMDIEALFSSIPDPGTRPDIPGAWAFTTRTIMLF